MLDDSGGASVRTAPGPVGAGGSARACARAAPRADRRDRQAGLRSRHQWLQLRVSVIA